MWHINRRRGRRSHLVYDYNSDEWNQNHAVCLQPFFPPVLSSVFVEKLKWILNYNMMDKYYVLDEFRFYINSNTIKINE